MARPCKLTPDVQERICRALEAGNTRKDAANHGGITYATFAAWCVRGRKSEAKYLDFLEAVKRAETVAVMAFVEIIKKAAIPRDEFTVKEEKRRVDGKLVAVKKERTKRRVFEWQAAAWWLERRRPEDFARRPVEELAILQSEIKELRRELREMREKDGAR